MSASEANDLIAESENIVKEHYSLGNVVSVVELQGGYINKTLLLTVRDDEAETHYVIRKYNYLTANVADIKFEHALLRHLKKQGFALTPDVIDSKYGETYVEAVVEVDGRETTRLWSVFECLRGEVRYAFFDTNLSDDELCSAASALAHLNHAGRDFYKAYGIHRSQTQIKNFLPTFRQTYSEYAEKTEQNSFNSNFHRYLGEILKKVDQLSTPDVEFTGMPMVAIHGDYHQGNLTFEANEVVGVFDFDWTRIDLRIFDLAQSIIYFCACWEGDGAEPIDLDKCYKFIKTYNDTHINGSTGGELWTIEQKKLPLMLEVANMFVLYCIVCFYYEADDSVEEECLMAFLHYVNIMEWLEANKDKLADVVNRACN